MTTAKISISFGSESRVFDCDLPLPEYLTVHVADPRTARPGIDHPLIFQNRLFRRTAEKSVDGYVIYEEE